MKAAILKANQVLSLESVPTPPAKPEECRIKVETVGVCSSDVQRAFHHGAYFYPLVMGHEIAGKVVQTGDKIEGDIQVGDRVSIFPLLPCQECRACRLEKFQQCQKYDYFGSRRNGGFTEYINVRPWNLLKLPSNVDFENAALIEPTAVALHCLRRARILGNEKRIESIAVLGGGFLGLVCCQLIARLRPEIKLSVFDRNPFKLEQAALLGAETHLIECEDHWAKTKNSQFDVVIESCGLEVTYRQAIALTASGGTTLLMGNPTSGLNLSQAELSAVLRKELHILGTWNSDFGSKNNDWKDVTELMAKGFSVSNLISHRIALSELPGTLSKVYQHKSKQISFPNLKIIVDKLDQ